MAPQTNSHIRKSQANRFTHVGTSGWNYDSWRGTFYSPPCPAEELLPRYAATFQTVELNNSFYQLPNRTSVEQWTEKTPDDFLFSIKASRYITHMKKLKDPQVGLSRLLKVMTPLGPKLGPILFQLPPSWHVNTERLAAFLDSLPKEYRYTFEFRDQTWLCQPVYDLLRRHNCALCFYDYRGFQSPEIPTADFIYLRLHGPKEQAYQGSYDGRTLAGYARKFLRWHEEGREVFCYFDNDEKAHAPQNARQLIASLNRLS